MKRLILWLWSGLVLVVIATVALVFWAQAELATADSVSSDTVVDIPTGTAYQGVLRQLVDAGRLSDRQVMWLRARARLLGTPQIKAGEYRIAARQSPDQIIAELVAGKVVLHRIQIIEGWTVQQAVKVVRDHPAIDPVLDAADLTPERLMAALGLDDLPAEGRLRPDTYAFPRGTTDRDFLRRAADAQQAAVERWWATRDNALPLDSPDALLIMASIIEKETGLGSERFEVSGVFANRLRRGMKLQTDPTVAYGVAPDFSGPLLRRHLDTDTPFNTYTRSGLPPTPICLPGDAALEAAAKPAETDNLYFVARGDGSGGHTFSRTLDAHNAAVQRYREALRRQAVAP
jgi:UPF0755 protein